MDRRTFAIEDIHIGKKRRAPDLGRVKSIAESIADVGLMNPPGVCIRNDFVMDDGEICDAVPVLIYGHHRLLALKSMGNVTTDCIVYDVDDLHAELMEIDENLARSELTAAEESAYILRRKAIWEEINSGGKNLPTRSEKLSTLGPQHHKQFASEIAEITGESKRGVNQKIARARELGDDIGRIVGTSLDKGVEMDALIKLPKEQRSSLIEKAASGETVSARVPPAADQSSHPDDVEEQRFWEFWASLKTTTRRKLLSQLRRMSA